jgi:tRNA pseudouridine13 synthase
MKNDLIVNAKLKDSPRDFIVEEIGEKWNCMVSEEFRPNLKSDLSNIDLESSKDFLWLEMEKLGIDHLSAMKEISYGLGISLDDIGYAGMKDKFAWTSQRLSIFHPNIEKLKEFSHEKIILKNFKWNKRKIKIGYLDGNKFTIILRDVDKKDAMKISNKIRSMDWFPNYFGVQRFGSQRKNNVKIGKLILKKKFEEAVMEILLGMGEENDEIIKARLRLRKERNFEEALRYFPRYLKLENKILYHLTKYKDDYLGAIKSCGRKNFLIYVNSVQSAIFNDVLSWALDEGLDFKKEGHKNCLLMGYKSRFYDGRLGEIEQQVLKNYGLELSDFDLKEIPFLRIKGSFRKAIVEVSELDVEVAEDEKYAGTKKIILSFVLPSGAYATTFLENFFVLN